MRRAIITATGAALAAACHGGAAPSTTASPASAGTSGVPNAMVFAPTGTSAASDARRATPGHALGDSMTFGARVLSDESRGVAFAQLGRRAYFVLLGVSTTHGIAPLVNSTNGAVLGESTAGVFALAPVRVADGVSNPGAPAGPDGGYDDCVRRKTSELAPRMPRTPQPTGRDASGRPVVTASDRATAESNARDAAASAAARACSGVAGARPTDRYHAQDFADGYLLLVAADKPFNTRELEQRVARLSLKADDEASMLLGAAEVVALGHGNWAASYVPWLRKR